jgi:hypothetical protein
MQEPHGEFSKEPKSFKVSCLSQAFLSSTTFSFLFLFGISRIPPMVFWQVHQTQLWAIIIYRHHLWHQPLSIQLDCNPQAISIVKLFSSGKKKAPLQEISEAIYIYIYGELKNKRTSINLGNKTSLSLMKLRPTKIRSKIGQTRRCGSSLSVKAIKVLYPTFNLIGDPLLFT